MHLKRFCLSALLLIFAGSALAADKTTHEYTLKNGLKLIVREDHRAPVVVSQVWYKVGSGYEPGGLTGISHVLEHMMFKGTKLYPAGVFSKTIAQNGGKENAFTSKDFTCYFQELEARRLPLSFKLEADRMQNLTLPEKEFEKEIEVVKEERRMRVDDNPQSVLYERFVAAAHLAAPYHHMTIGWMNDLDNLEVEDLQQWYDTWYAPNNAVLVVVGDVKPDDVYKLAQHFFGPIKSRPVPILKPQREPKPLGIREVRVKAPAKLPVMYLGFNTPSLRTMANPKDAYALDVLSGILGGGESARLYKNLLREQQIASAVSSDYDLYQRFDGLFTIEGIPSKGKSNEALLKAINDQVTKLQRQPVSDKELDRVKTQVMAAKIYAKDSLFGQAMVLGALESVGIPWREGENYAKHIQAVTAEQVQAVAQKYLTPERLVIATLEPLPMKTKQSPKRKAA